MIEAGRELDALVARRLLGLTVYQATPIGYDVLIGYIDPKYELYLSTDHGWVELPEYSTDIAAAWLVVEKLAASGWRMELKVLYPSNRYGVQFNSERESALEFAPTAPLAICLAALKAISS